MKPNLYKCVFQVHRWTGLTIGMVILMMALTGAVNLFRPQLEPTVNRELLTVPTCSERVPLDALGETARAAHMGGRLDYIKLSAGEPGAARMPAARVRFDDPQVDVYMNPCTGAVVGERPRYGGVLGTIEQTHILRFSEEKWVRSITGVCAIIFGIVLIGGGSYMWWPRRRGYGRALRLDVRLEGRARSMNQHKIAGVYGSLFLIALILTGLPLVFEWYRNGLYTLTGSPLPQKPPKSAPADRDSPRVSMEAFWQKVQALEPNPEHALLKYPGEGPNAPLEAYMVARGAPHENARSLLFIDAYSGKVLRYTPYEKASAGFKLYFWMISFHTGSVGGWPMKLILLFGTLMVPVLAYTGIRSYLRRRKSPAAAPALAAPMPVRVRRIAFQAADIKSFELVSTTGDPLPAFTPGSHIDVRIEDGLQRQYSLCNDPNERHRYLIAVKRIAGSHGGSRAMHELVEEGDLLSISAPRNHFALHPAAAHHVLVAGGIGITPLLCMARHLLSIGASFELHYFTRSIEQTAFHAALSAPEFAPHVSFHCAIERSRLRETLHPLLSRRAADAHLYLCGPRGFMNLVEELAAAAWPAGTVHVEHFAANPLASAGERKPFEVTLARSGGTFTVPVSKSIVNVLAERGVCVATSCEQGVCGTCLTGVLEGKPDHRDAFLSPQERIAGAKMLVCVSRASTPRLVLDL
ncbi:PepSY domain-containing protein [Variovorax sp. LjRoot290]|uniref:PepSY domain-containing protein n=1 Tax=Variovorax sp. LjRoot290 TaxID=3342316 RepID=UPI003F513317